MSDSCGYCIPPATRHASLQILFKSCTPANVFETAATPLRFAHFWQDAQSLAPAPQKDASTSKSGPNMVCFAHFDFEMCFAPQRRALFRQLNVQKWSETASFLTLLTSKCASRRNGVQLFISHLATWLRTRRFSERTLRPSGATNHWKNTVFRDFATFSRACIFFLLTLPLL